jgi:hypothetical protein
LEAHSFSFQPNFDEKKVLSFADASSQKSKEAISKSLPEYLNDLKTETIQSQELAAEANAEVLSPDIYEQAKLLLVEANELANPPSLSERTDTSIKRYNEATEAFEKSRELSLSQVSGILDSSADIETDLDQIEKYSNSDKTKINQIKKLREDYRLSTIAMQDGKVKQGMNSIEKIRAESSLLKSELLFPYAKDRAKLANESILNAEKKMASRDYPINAESSDNLAAAKESYKACIDLISQERFYDSIQSSNESIKLAQTILNEKELLASKRNSKLASTSKDSKKDSDTEKAEPIKESKTVSLDDDKGKAKFVKYTIKKTDPPQTLWMIAADKKNLGNKNLWKKIYSANKKQIKDPDKIYPNQVILIPKK